MKIARLFSVMVFALILTACTTKPIYNIGMGIIPAGQSLEESGQLITKALQYKRWQVLSTEPGKIIATIDARKHSATISIEFDDKHYTVTHVNSTNLKFNASKQTIHRNYNQWIHNIEKEIKFYFSNKNVPTEVYH